MATETDRMADGAPSDPQGRSKPQRTTSSAPSVRPSVALARRVPRRAVSGKPRGGRATAAARGELRTSLRPALRRPLGQLCPCGLEPATVELRLGPVYAKVCKRCFTSGVHLAHVLAKLLGE